MAITYHNFTQLKPTRQVGGCTSYTNGTGVFSILADAQYLSWSHSATNPRICFTTHVSGICRIGICNADGTGIEQFTTGSEAAVPGGDDFYAHWAPDDSAIAFQRNTGNYDTPTGAMEIVICVKDLATGAARQLTSGQQDGHPSWSPDGQHIVFNRQTDGLMVVPALGGDPYYVKDPVPLPDDGVERLHGGHPTWSADNRIAYVSGKDGSISYVDVTPGGRYASGPTVLYPRTSGFPAHPTWSPDCTELAFSREDWASSTDITLTLFVLDVATRKVKAQWAGGCPDWSPALTP